MLKQCVECGTETDDSLIMDTDIFGNIVLICGPCFREQNWEE